MRQIACCRGAASGADAPPEAPLGRASRAARAFVGVAFIAQAGLLYVWPLAALVKAGLPAALAWALAAAGAWLGASHVVAAASGYRGCPELGAIASVLLRRRIVTTCAPWERFDRAIERRSGSTRARLRESRRAGEGAFRAR